MRKDWLDKLGINPDPDGDLCITLDDIAAVAKAFVDANVSGGNHTVGMAFSGNDIADAMCIANAMVGAFSSALFSQVVADSIPQVPRFILAILVGAAVADHG